MAGDVEKVREALRGLETIPDAIDRAAACAEVLQEWPQLHTLIADIRQQAVITAKSQGAKYKAIGERTNTSGEVASQIARGVGRASHEADAPD